MARTIAAVAGLTAVALASSGRPRRAGRGGTAPPLDTVDTFQGGWKPDVRAAKRYARDRTGDVCFAFMDPYGSVPLAQPGPLGADGEPVQAAGARHLPEPAERAQTVAFTAGSATFSNR